MRRICLAALALLTLALVALTPGRAEAAFFAAGDPSSYAAEPATEPIWPEQVDGPDPDDPYASAIAEGELDAMRGGFSLGGVEVSFGANVRTYVDGALALETVFHLTATGMNSEVVFDAGYARLADALPDLAAAGVAIEGLGDLAGIAVIDGKGATAIAHRVDTNAILGAVLNNAGGRNVSQFIDVQIGVSDFAAWSSALSEQRTGFQIGADFANDAVMALSAP